MKYLLQTGILSLEFNPSNLQMELVWQRVAAEITIRYEYGGI